MKYSDYTWTQELSAVGWDVRVAPDLSAVHRLMQEHPFVVALMVPGKINEDACAEVDDFLRTHHGVEWIGVFEPALVETPRCRDLIVDQLFDHHTTPHRSTLRVSS